MTPPQDPLAEARAFIVEHVDSVAQLDTLLLLRTDPEQKWTAARLSQELRADMGWVVAQLRSLCERGFVARVGEHEFRYQPVSPALDRGVAAAARAYLVHRVAVIEMVHTRPTKGVRVFADAFRLRRKEQGDV